MMIMMMTMTTTCTKMTCYRNTRYVDYADLRIFPQNTPLIVYVAHCVRQLANNSRIRLPLVPFVFSRF